MTEKHWGAIFAISLQEVFVSWRAVEGDMGEASEQRTDCEMVRLENESLTLWAPAALATWV